MPGYVNLLLSILVLLVAIPGIVLVFRKQVRKEAINMMKNSQEHLEMEYLINEVKELMFQLTTRQFDDKAGSKEVHERELNRRIELKKALKGCSNGSYEDKTYIVDFIGDLLEKYLVKEEEVDKVLAFDKPGFLTPKDKFDILLYCYGREYENKALAKLIEEREWDKEQVVDYEELPVYVIGKEQVEEAYFDHRTVLNYKDKIHIIAQRIYENYKGFGAVDIIRDMDVDGISGGVSGIVDQEVVNDPGMIKNYATYGRNYESIWIFYKGKSIHLSFLSFGSERELKRICQSIYRYNKAGQLSEDVGYKVNEMKDGSRVVVVRPPFSESWAFFIRKFHLKNMELDQLIRDPGAKLAISTLKFLMKGGRITSVTGSQGSGKTTLLMSMIKHIHPSLTLRVQEMSFELNLRKLYPYRNILTFKETESVSGQEGLDLQKKTDGSVNVLGEIATDEISVLMLQMAQVASLFTVFTHHAKTVSDLILSLRNSLLKCNVFRDEKIAEEQVVRVMDFDVHLNRTYTGERYIERISEIIPKKTRLIFDRKYKDVSGNKMEAFMDTMVDYFESQMPESCFEEKIIVYYKDGSYHIGEPISKSAVEEMLQLMAKDDRTGFLSYLSEAWGDHYAYLY